MFAAVALLPVLAALASATVTPTDIAVLEANWQGALLTDFTPNLAPQGILEGDFVNATIGTLVPQADTATQPNLSLNALASFTGNGTYSVFLVDANYAGTTANGTSQNLHWMENGVTLGTANDGSYPLTFDKATNTKPYQGPGPAEGSGSHRYMFLLYEQPADFTAPDGFTQPINSVNAFSLPDYVTNAKLGNLVGANYIQVENGQSTVSAVSTSAVDTATISAASSSGTVGAGATGSGGTGAGGALSTAATSGATAVPAATTSKGSGAGVVAPAVGLAAVAAVAALFV